MGRWAIARHLSAAASASGCGSARVWTAPSSPRSRSRLFLLLVRAGWAPLRRLDTGAAEAFNRIDALSRR